MVQLVPTIVEISFSNFVVHCICIFLIVISGEKFVIKSEEVGSDEMNFVPRETTKEISVTQEDVEMQTLSTENGKLNLTSPNLTEPNLT